MNLDLLQIAYYIIATVAAFGSIGAGALAWSAKQAAKNATTAAAAARVEPLEARVVVLEKENVQFRERQRAMERELAAVPTKEALGEIKVEMARIGGAVEAVRAKVEGLDGLVQRVETAVAMHQEHLLKRAQNV